MTTSRRWLRQKVGRLTSEMILCTATSAGTTTTFIDAVKLVQENNTLIGREALILSGAGSNPGSIRRVAGNSKASASVTLSPALTDATSANDQMELWNELDVGSCLDEVHDLLNYFIVAVAQAESKEVVATPATFDRASPELAIDPSWERFSGADYQDRDGIWHALPDYGIELDRARRVVILRDTLARLAHGLSVRLRGLDAAAELTSDDDATTVDPEWLVMQTAGQLLVAHSLRQVGGNVQAMQSLGNFYLSRADPLRLKNAARTSRAARAL